MRKFLTKITLFLAIQFVIAFAVLLMRPADPQGFFAAAIDKHERANQQSGPRLLLIGGSNLAFGIASDVLQRRIAYRPVNLALTAGLGLDYILNEARSLVRNRDVVIVSLEYEHFLKDHTSPSHVQLLLEARPESAKHFSASQLKTLLDDGLVYAHNHFRKALHGAIRSNARSVYRRSAFNQFGDVIGHHELSSLYAGYLKANPRELQRVKSQRIDGVYLGRIIKRLNTFARTCRQRGSRVYLTYPPLADDAYAIWQQKIETIQQQLKQQLEFPTLLNPDEVVYPAAEFFDTCYHLNARCKSIRTQLLAESLIGQLRKNQVASRAKGHDLRR